MRTTVLQSDLSRALGIVSRSVSSKPQVPVLGNILLKEKGGSLEVVGTNLEVGVRVVVTGKIDKGFEITVPSRQFTEFVGGIPAGQVELVINEDKLEIVSGKFKAVISGIAASEFPVVPVPGGESTIVLNRELLAKKLEMVVFAAGTDESRPVLSAVLMGFGGSELILVATDGYRLSKVELKVNESKTEMKLLIPARVISELLRLCKESEVKDVNMWVSQGSNQVIFKLGESELISRLVEGSYPDYKKIIPSNGKILINADKQELLRAIKLASIFAKESANVVKFSAVGQLLRISANSPQLGGEDCEVEIEHTGEDVEMAFNFRYVLEFLNNISSESIKLESNGALTPGLFKAEGDFVHIIMPVRVQAQ